MKSAVLVIDLQLGLLEDSGKPFDYENVIERINSITAYARKHQWPVIFIQHESEGNWKHGSPGWAILPELRVEPSDLRIRKTTPNSFLNTELNENLNSHQIDNLIISGYATEYCVDSTVRAAAALGYDIQIVSDAHTTHDKNHASAEFIRKHHNESLAGMKSFGVSIKAISAEEILRVI